MKQINPKLKTLLAVGGWNAGTREMTIMLKNKASRSYFIKSVIELLRKWAFDGFDLDFEYPASRGSPSGDRNKFSKLVRVGGGWVGGWVGGGWVGL